MTLAPVAVFAQDLNVAIDLFQVGSGRYSVKCDVCVTVRILSGFFAELRQCGLVVRAAA